MSNNQQTPCVNEFRITGRVLGVVPKSYGAGKTMQIAKIDTTRPSKEGETDCVIELACFGFAATKATENVGAVVTITGYIETNERGFLNLRTMQFMVNDPAVFDGVGQPEKLDDEEDPRLGGRPDEDDIPF